MCVLPTIMKNLRVTFDNEDYDILLKRKNRLKLSWRKYILSLRPKEK